MATTTNYSWTTPDDTDLVKDGAAAIRTLGSSVDTTVKALSPGTTAGDIDYYTTSTAKARVAIGTAGQVLAVNSGETAPEWTTISAGGMTLISTTSLTGGTVNLTSIPGTYKHLQLIIVEAYANTDADFAIRLNADTGAASYDDGYIRNRAGSVSAVAGTGRTNMRIGDLKGASTKANRFSTTITIPRYTDTTQNAIVNSQGRSEGINTGNSIGSGYYGNRTAAITQINIICDGGTFSAGTAYLYGVS
jgi:hypothetical protein